MIALSDKIAGAPAVKPWCAGIGSGDATGWPATDWLEDVMLRARRPRRLRPVGQPRDPVQRPEGRRRRSTEVGDILKNPTVRQRRLRRRRSPSPRRPSRTAACRSSTASAAMHRQASFYAANWPEGTKVAEDGDVFAFYLPAIDADVRQAGPRRRRVRDRVLRQARGPGVPDLPVDRHVGQREGQGHPGRRLGQRQQGSGRDQPGQPDRQAVGCRSCRTRRRSSASTVPTRCPVRSAPAPSGRR